MTKQDFIFSLIRSALWQQPYPHFDMTPHEYQAVMEEAEKQCVQGLIIDCLRSNNMGLQKKCVIHMMKIYNALVAENRRLNENVVSLGILLKSHDIDYIVMKGQTLAALYPKPELRVPGDIDFYVSAKDFSRAMEVINDCWQQEISIDDISNGKHLAFEYNNNDFEMHQMLVIFPCGWKNDYFARLLDSSGRSHVQIGMKEIATIQPTLNVFYTFCHLFHHLRVEGVALRQICDWAILIHVNNNVIDWTKLRQILMDLKYKKCFAAFGCIAIEKLGLPKEDFPLALTERERRWAKKILDDIWKHGNWGKYSRDIITEAGFRRSIQSGWQYMTRYFKYFGLTPDDNFYYLTCRIPYLFVQSIRKNIRKVICSTKA